MARKRRIVELAAAMSLAAVSGAAAFLGVPLEYRPEAPSSWARASTGAAKAELPGTVSARVARRAVITAVAPTTPRPVDDLFAAWSPPAVPYRDPGPEDLRLHPLGWPMARLGPELGRSGRDALDEVRTDEVLFLLGASQQAVGDFEKAAEYYEAFAKHHPSVDGASCDTAEREQGICPDAPAALENAIVLRRALGQTDRALDDAELFQRTYGETRIADAVRVATVVGRMLERDGADVEAAAHYGELAQAHATPARRLRVLVRLGRSEWAAGERRAATRRFRAALRTWQHGLAERLATTPEAAEDGSGTEFARTLEAVAEAAFHLAEVRRDAFVALASPRYEGDGSPADVDRWVGTRLRPWIVRKASALRRARDAYERVASLGVTEWTIAAEARTGEMLRLLLEDLRQAPVAMELREDGEQIVGVILPPDWREPALAQLEAPAVAAYERCLRTATRTRRFGRWSERCADALTRLAPRRHPPMTELRPTRLRP